MENGCNHKGQINRFKRINGQINGVIKMIEEEKNCEEILMQLSAIENAIKSAAVTILKDHMNHCVVEAIEAGNQERLSDFNKILDKYLK